MEKKSVIASQKVAIADLTSIEQQLEKNSLSPDQGGYDPHPAVGAYHSPYHYSSAVNSLPLPIYCYPQVFHIAYPHVTLMRKLIDLFMG